MRGFAASGRRRPGHRLVGALAVLGLAVGWLPALGSPGRHAALGPLTPFVSLATWGPRQLVYDVTTGRRLLVPSSTPVLARLPGSTDARLDALRATGRHGRVEAQLLASASAADPSRVPAGSRDGWDPRMAGARRSVFYRPVRATTGPGRITSLFGGSCDGLPGPQASVSPGNVRTDAAGRVFWVDMGSNLHLQAEALIRTVDPDGRVRTLGNLTGPLEGRLTRGWSLAVSNVRIVPDGRGGVFYAYNADVGYGMPFDADWQAEDVPAGAPAIGHLRADGSNEFIAGFSRLPTDHNDGGPVSHAAFDAIDAIAADREGNLYVADGPSYPVGGSDPGVAAGGGSSAVDPSLRYADNQQAYQAVSTIRFLNRSHHPVTFYAGTPQQITVAPGRVATIAGDRAPNDLSDVSDGTTPSPAPGDPPVAARQARIPFVAGMTVASDGIRLLVSSQIYVKPSNFGEDLLPSTSSVYLLALNTGTGTQRMNGRPAASGYVTVLGGGAPGYAGDGGPVTSARFDVRNHDGWFYGDLVDDGQGGVLVADTYNARVRDVGADGTVRTLLGGGSALSYPMGAAPLGGGGLVVSDWGHSRLLRVAADGTVTTLAGNGHPSDCGFGTVASGDANDPQDLAAASGPRRNRPFVAGADVGVASDAVTDSRGNTYVAIPNLGVVLRVAPDGTVTRAVGQPRPCAPVPPLYTGLAVGCPLPSGGSGDGGSPRDAVLMSPEHLLVDPYDNLYVSDGGAIRYVNFGARALRPQGVLVRPGTIGTVFRRPVDRLHLPESGGLGSCGDFCGAYVDLVRGLGAMTLDPRGTLYVVDTHTEQVLGVTYCGDDFLVAGKAQQSLQQQLADLIANKPQPPVELVDGTPAYLATITPVDLAYDRGRDLLLFTESTHTDDHGGSVGRVLAVNVGSRPVPIWGQPLAPRALVTYAGGGPCAQVPVCSYGDGSHARHVAFAFAAGLAVTSAGVVFVADVENRIRVVRPNGVVGTVAGLSRDIYDGFDIGSAATSWWFIGGECGDGGAAARACFSGVDSIDLTPQGDLLVVDDISGRIRRISDIAHAPVRASSRPASGTGWGFTAPASLANFGSESVDPTMSFDAEGRAYVMAPLPVVHGSSSLLDGPISLEPSPGTVPCAVWRYDVDVDGHGHDAATYLSEPDLADATVDPAAPSGRHCSIAVSPPGGSDLDPPPGSADRIVFTSGHRSQTGEGDTVVTGASRDAAHTFLTSPDGVLTTTDGPYLTDPWVLPLDADTSGTLFQSPETSSVVFGISRGGTEYVETTPVVTYGVRDFLQPDLVASAPALRGSDVVAATTPTTLHNCQAVVDQLALACDFTRDSSTTRMLVARSTDRGATWDSPTTVFTKPCRHALTWSWEPYCLGYHGLARVVADSAGNVYAVWDDGRHVLVSVSRDGTRTWSRPLQVDRGVAAAGMPAVVAGDGGRLAIAFYGSTSLGRDVATPNDQWWVYLAESTDASSSHPHFVQTLVTRSEVHEGTLCLTSGTLCGFGGDAGPAEAGNYLQVALDPVGGHVAIAYSESRGILDHADTATIDVTRQCDGPSLLARPRGQPRCSTTDAGDGGERVPVTCAPQGRDARGDATWSGADPPALDLTGLGFHLDGTTLTARIDVASLSPAPPSGATAMAWTAIWRWRDVDYYLRAVTPAAGDTGAPTVQVTWGVQDRRGQRTQAGSATGGTAGSSVYLSVPAAAVGEPAPGTPLFHLRATAQVLTGGFPGGDAAPTATWTTVDRMAARAGYDVGLTCGSLGRPAAVVPGGPSAPHPAPRPAPQPVGRAGSTARVPWAHAAGPGRGPRAAATPSITPSLPVPTPTVSVSIPPLLPPPSGPPVIPACGVLPPVVPTPAPVGPHHRHLVVPPVVPHRTRPAERAPARPPAHAPVQSRGIVVAVEPPAAVEAESVQSASQGVNQLAGAAQREPAQEPALGFAAAAAALTVVAGAVAVRNRFAGATETSRAPPGRAPPTR